MSEDLDNVVTQNPPAPDSYLDTISWVPAKYMTADIGSKYQTFGNNDSQNKILTHDIVGPNSEHFRGMQWMRDIDKEYDEQNIMTARDMKTSMAFKHDEAVAFKSGLKNSKVTQLTDLSMVHWCKQG